MTKDEITTVLQDHNTDGQFNDVLQHIASGDFARAVSHFPKDLHIFPAVTHGLAGDGMAIPVQVSDAAPENTRNADVEAAYEELKRLASESE